MLKFSPEIESALLSLIELRREREAKRLETSSQLELQAKLANRPSVFFHAYVERDGSQWTASYGELVGRGRTPDEALEDFDYRFTNG